MPRIFYKAAAQPSFRPVRGTPQARKCPRAQTPGIMIIIIGNLDEQLLLDAMMVETQDKCKSDKS